MNISQLLDSADLMVTAHQYESAFTTYNQIIKEYDDCDEAYLLRGELYGKLGQFENAFSDVLKAISIDSNYDESYMVLATLYLAQNNPEKSIEAYQKAIALDNKKAAGRIVLIAEKLADQLIATHFPDRAVINYELAIKYAPDNSNLLYKHAFTVVRIGDFKRAFKLIEHILKKDPEHIATKSLLVTVYEKTGQPEKGWVQIKKLVGAYPENAHINIVFGKYALQNGKQADGINSLKLVAQQTGLKTDDQLSIHMLLGKLYDSIASYSDAFSHFSKANNLKYNDYDVAAFEEQVSQLINYFSKERYNDFISTNTQSNVPIFILGMPRSGTSLVEQIISSHSQVYGAGELQLIPNIVSSMEKLGSGVSYPQVLSNLSVNSLSDFSEEILKDMHSLSSGSLRVTDKLPHNFLFIGLIHKLLPKAKIINCLRNPIDNCLSCYFQHFGGYHPYAYDLSHLEKYYQQYRRLMKHWQSELEIPILNVQYERLVKNTKSEVEEILNYLDLGWDDECMQFYNQKRAINTSSYTQVKKEMYTDSINRWMNYKSYIGSLKNL